MGRTLRGKPAVSRTWLMLGAARALERQKHTVGPAAGPARSRPPGPPEGIPER